MRDKHKFQCVATWGSVALAMMLSIQCVNAQALPEWTPEDRAKLKKGEIIAGASLLIDAPPVREVKTPKPSPKIVELLEVEPELPYDPTLLPEEFLSSYFMESPESHLVDPQHLLSRQETIDHEGFLTYHAKESKIDIKLYLFDAEQIIPNEYTIERLAYEQYENTKLTAIAFCFLGNPSRNQLVFGGEESGSVKTLALQKVLDDVLIKAMEKSEPTAQVEAFAVELSIKLYWMEEDIHALSEQGLSTSNVESVAMINLDQLAVFDSSATLVVAKPSILYPVVGISSVLLSISGILGIVLLWRRGRSYEFPVLEIPRRLGADYAAGIGAVLAFHNKYGSPANQKDQVAEYSMKI